MTIETRQAAAVDAYAFARSMARGQLDRDAAEVETHAVQLMKSALRMGGVLGGVAAALQIAHECVDELATIERRRTNYADPQPEPTPAAAPDPFEQALAIVGGWTPPRLVMA